MEEQKPTIKRTPKWVIGLIIGGVVFISIISIIILVIFIISVFNASDFYGKWDCNGTMLEIDANKFNMYTSDGSIKVDAKYSIKKIEDKNSGKSVTLNVTADKRVISGKTYNSSYTTQFELIVDKEDKDNMVMMNTVTYSIYSCRRVK